MLYITIHTIHLLSAFIYGGFLFVDIFFLSRMKETLDKEQQQRARESIMLHVRKVVPYALLVAVISGGYLVSKSFGEISSEGLSSFQLMLGIKAFLGLWLGLRGAMQLFFKINPLVFKGHLLPFSFVVMMIILSQFMYA